MKTENDIEKAHVDGDVHPNGKWVWVAAANNNKGDWRARKNPSASTSTTTPKPMDSQKLAVWAGTTSDDNLLKVANSKNGNAQMRKIAYDELTRRNFDMSKVDTSGSLGVLMKMTGSGPKNTTNPVSIVSDEENDDSSVDVNGVKTVGLGITEKWYLDKNDDRVKKMFNLKTKEGRIKYDQFVYRMKRKEKDYMNPIEVVQDLNEQYLEFLDNNEQRFMISAGGAGIGKSYGFNKMAELLNKKPFGEGDQPGDGDYDIFEAPDINSGKQLLNILKAHNGKIIVFDDNDKVIRRTDCASVMKKATSSTGTRIVGDPDDIKQNFEFTGRIIVMTNKDLATLAESEDTKAIISRAMMVSEIYMTVPETIEVMENRYQDYEFKQAPRLDDEAEDKREREEIFSIIKKNEKNIDPSQFTTRTFQEILINKRKVDNANEKRKNPAFASLIGSNNKEWKEKALAILTKANTIDFGDYNDSSDELEKADEPSLEKAEDLLLGEIEDIKKSQYDDMTLEKAEDLLLGEIEEQPINKSEEDELEKAEDLLLGDVIEKSKSGIYADTSENKKLGRVGQKYGSEKKEEKSSSKKKEGEDSKNGAKSLSDHAKTTSSENLKKVIATSTDPKLREAAHDELKRRDIEEAKVEDKKDKTIKKAEENEIEKAETLLLGE